MEGSEEKCQHYIREAMHQAEVNNSETKFSSNSSSPLHIIQSQTDNKFTVDIAENQLSMEKYVGTPIREHTESDSEDDKHEVLPSCTLPNIKKEPEELSLKKDDSKLLSENVDVKKESEPHFEQEAQKVQMESPVPEDRHFEQEAQKVQMESPVPEDRNLEQFSEVLLDSDSSVSNLEVIANEIIDNKKDGKRVRFADEVGATESDEGRRLSRSPPPQLTLPLANEAKHPGVPVNPSPTSTKQYVNDVSLHQHTVDELIVGVEYPAKYLGSTPILLSGIGAIKSARMHQAQQAVKLIKDPENECRPQFEVGIKISTQAVKIVDSKANIDLMEHPLHTISYVADIEGVLVIMAHLGPAIESTSACSTPDRVGVSEGSYTPKITCHVLDTENARHVARVIGQAFTAAYKEFLKSSGISEEALEDAEYAHILNAQSVPQVEIETLSDRSKLKKITMAKSKGDILGIMVMEAGYGSAIPACVVVHLSKNGAAFKSGLLNVGDHIISINGISVVGMPTKSCVEQIKKCRSLNVVKMMVCSVPAVVDVTIVRPDLKYQLGFSVHEGMICSIIRGSIGERSGIRIGHRIIDINGTSTVNMSHQDIVHLLSCTVGDLQIRTMPDLMYKLLTGQVLPEYN